MLMNEGNYHGKLVRSGTDTFKNEKQTPYMYMTFSIEYEAIDGKWVSLQPVERDVVLFLTDKAWETTQSRLKGMGFNGSQPPVR